MKKSVIAVVVTLAAFAASSATRATMDIQKQYRDKDPKANCATCHKDKLPKRYSAPLNDFGKRLIKTDDFVVIRKKIEEARRHEQETTGPEGRSQDQVEREAAGAQAAASAAQREARATEETGEATSWADSPFMKAVDQMDQQRQQLNRDLAERDRQATERAREQLERANEAARQQLAAAEAARLAAQKSQSAPPPTPTSAGALLVVGHASASLSPTPRPAYVPPTTAPDAPFPDITLSNLSWANPANSGAGCSLGEGANPQSIGGTWWRQTLSFSIVNPAPKAILVNVSFRVGGSTTNRSYRVAAGSTQSFSEQFATSCSVWVPLSAAYRWQVTSTSWAAY